MRYLKEWNSIDAIVKEYIAADLENLSDILQEMFDELNITEVKEGETPSTDIFWKKGLKSIFIVSKVSVKPGKILEIYNDLMSRLPLIEKRFKRKLSITKTDMMISIEIPAWK